MLNQLFELVKFAFNRQRSDHQQIFEGQVQLILLVDFYLLTLWEHLRGGAHVERSFQHVQNVKVVHPLFNLNLSF